MAPSAAANATQLQEIQRSLERAAHQFNLNAEQEDFQNRRQNQQEVIKANAVALGSHAVISLNKTVDLTAGPGTLISHYEWDGATFDTAGNQAARKKSAAGSVGAAAEP